jgi:UDP-N-acetylglucosamine acyltransferase
VPIDLPALLDRIRYRYPSFLVDAIADYEPGVRVVAHKNVSVNEDFFPGHFPGAPVMPAVLMIEALTQLAAILVLERPGASPTTRMFLRGVDNAKFRRQVVPGDRMTLDVRLGSCRTQLARAQATAYVDGQMVVEAELLLGVVAGAAFIDPTAHVHPAARIGEGTTIGPHCTIAADVTIGKRCTIGASTVIEGFTEIGDDTRIFPMASIGLAPQDLKYKGERTRLVIGTRNILREFVTINRGTVGGGGETRIGDQNLIMAYVHVAHDCQIGSEVIMANAATLAGHVTIDDRANVGAYSGVHQFCRIGYEAFVGGYSVVVKDAPPFAVIQGNHAKCYGLNRVGMRRRGYSKETIEKLHRAFHLYLSAKLNTTQALTRIREEISDCAEVDRLVEFIESSKRGVVK